MRIIRAFLLIIASVSVLSGCGDSGANNSMKLGGVGVGNGATFATFHSDQGFQFQYGKNLQITSDTNRYVRVDNKALAKKNISRVEFKVMQSAKDTKSILNEEGLRTYLAKNRAGYQFERIELGGGIGFKTESREAGKLAAEYFLFAPSKLILNVVILAFEEAQGLELIAPIVSTVRYDVNPPELKGLKLSVRSPKTALKNPAVAEVHAGSEISIELEITDDDSGVLETISTHFASEKLFDGVHAVTGLSGRIKHILDDTYLATFRISEFAPSDTYSLREVTISDKAGNARTYYGNTGDKLYRMSSQPFEATELPNEFHYGEGTWIPSKLEIPMLQIQNTKKPDLEYPRVSSIKLSAKEVNAGETIEVIVKATDDVSGIAAEELQLFAYPKLAIEDENHVYDVEAARNVEVKKSETEPDTYRFLIKISPNAPAGEYNISTIDIYDRSGKCLKFAGAEYFETEKKPGPPKYLVYKWSRASDTSSPEGDFMGSWVDEVMLDMTNDKSVFPDFPVLTFNVKNTIDRHIVPPIVHAIKFESDQIIRGDQAVMKMKITDHGSDLRHESVKLLFRLESDMGALPLEAKTGELTPLEDDWYSLSFKIHPRWTPGKYVIEFISIQGPDKAVRYYYASLKGERYTRMDAGGKFVAGFFTENKPTYSEYGPLGRNESKLPLTSFTVK